MNCPYCNRQINDEQTVCNHCFASIPHDEPKEAESSETNETLRVTKKKIRS